MTRSNERKVYDFTCDNCGQRFLERETKPHYWREVTVRTGEALNFDGYKYLRTVTEHYCTKPDCISAGFKKVVENESKK